jgi:hypothetical protein
VNKLELIQALKGATDLTKPENTGVVNVFFNEMANELVKAGRVESGGGFAEHTIHDWFNAPLNQSQRAIDHRSVSVIKTTKEDPT